MFQPPALLRGLLTENGLAKLRGFTFTRGLGIFHNTCALVQRSEPIVSASYRPSASQYLSLINQFATFRPRNHASLYMKRGRRGLANHRPRTAGPPTSYLTCAPLTHYGALSEWIR